jgi:thiaminase/transcriptional activator TenA
MAGQRLSVELWDGITEIYDAILGHPFVTGLADGSLSPTAFAFYVVQDALYLEQYALALAAVASLTSLGRPAGQWRADGRGAGTLAR